MKKRFNYRNIFIFVIFISVLILFGYLSGKVIGTHLLLELIVKEDRTSLFFYRPAEQYFKMYRLINSDSELDRLSGYYSLLENDMIDEDFLYERFSKERSTSVRRNIIWILGFADDFKAVKEIYNKIFIKDNIVIKREILRSINRRDNEYYMEFIKRHGVEDELLMELNKDIQDFFYNTLITE